MASRLEAGALGAGTLAALSGAYLVLAYLAVLISRTELRLPTVQYNRAALPEEVGARKAVRHAAGHCLQRLQCNRGFFSSRGSS